MQQERYNLVSFKSNYGRFQWQMVKQRRALVIFRLHCRRFQNVLHQRSPCESATEAIEEDLRNKWAGWCHARRSPGLLVDLQLPGQGSYREGEENPPLSKYTRSGAW